MRSILIMSISLLMLFGCKDQKVAQIYPMISLDSQDQFNLVDYQNNTIFYLFVQLDNGVVVTRTEPVYISNQSEISTKYHGQLTDENGYFLYWTKAGDFINSNYERVDKSQFFVVGEKLKPLDDRPLMVRELWERSGRSL